ncbi:CGNR zinc finger domain-containing protein [Streptomyces sp. NPDC021224]|uniref:CGNR zinc finger domain-containing protein n=1 Tax=unclassified Streptomyces TaxID=2593676 RepID=UPI0037A970CA
MLFDSHMQRLLEASVALVNDLTDGRARGRDYTAPRGPERCRAVRTALSVPARHTVTQTEADELAGTAQRLREVFEAAGGGRLDDAAETLNALLLARGARPQLDRDPDRGWQLHFHGRDDSLAVGWGAGCATGLAVLLGGGLAGRLGVCAATACDRVYVDTSRNSARQFCSTACQNRTKAAAFRARQTG